MGIAFAVGACDADHTRLLSFYADRRATPTYNIVRKSAVET